MEKLKSIHDYLNESANGSINENASFNASNAVNSIVKQIRKDFDLVKPGDNEESFQKVKNGLLNNKGISSMSSMRGILHNIIKATKLTKQLLNELSNGIYNEYEFYFKGDKLMALVAASSANSNYFEILYYDENWFGWNNSAETYFSKLYPKLFPTQWYEIYAYSDVNMGYGHAGTLDFIEAITKEDAKNKSSIKDWVSNGIQEISDKELKIKKKQIKDMADHYAALVKKLGI